MPTTSRRAVSTAVAALGVLALAGCSGASDAGAGTAPRTTTSSASSPLPSSAPDQPQSSSAAPSSPASPASASPGSSTPGSSTPASSTPAQSTPASPRPAQAPTGSTAPSSPAAPGSPAPAAALDRLLLDADELPGFDKQFSWSDGHTVAREPKAGVGTCQQFPLSSIGATGVAYRSYNPPPKSVDSAEELVAAFPDTRTARRAFAVLKSWRARCRSQLGGYATRQVGRLEDVARSEGDGAWYLLVYGPAPQDSDSGVFDAQGMALVDTRVAMVELKSVGQDYDYPPGKEPMVAAVRAAAHKLTG